MGRSHERGGCQRSFCLNFRRRLVVLPVHPEGPLRALNIMHQTHLTMQSLSFGKDSLLNGVRRTILAGQYRREKKMTAAQAEAAVAQLDLADLGKAVGHGWRKYLTLLNLRNWETLSGRPVTEQIYVHSKLLIADDRVAILGSANINDRSQLGDRDSELAVTVWDAAATQVALDGKRSVPVSASVHNLRKELWRKLFGLVGGKSPASELASVIDKPAAPATWEAIQRVADDNTRAYEKAFLHIPRSVALPSVQPQTDPEDPKPAGSLWPTWRYVSTMRHTQSGKLLYRMPFEETFWRDPAVRDSFSSWSGTQTAPEAAPKDVNGFIVSLPINWTYGENNISGMSLTMLADNQLLRTPDGQPAATAIATNAQLPEKSSAT